MSGRKRGSGMTSDDEFVWTHVTRSVHPLRRSARRVADTETTSAPTTAAPTPREDDPAPRSDLSRLGPVTDGKPRWQPFVPQPASRPKAAPSPQTFDKRHARKIASGRIEIEGRIDLHGLREAEAHMRLRGFLRQAHAQGKRTVLVITGKGRESDDPHAPFDYGHDRSPRGILKRNVPRWLAEPDLAGLVVSFTSAHIRHGGEGALYVHLRRA